MFKFLGKIFGKPLSMYRIVPNADGTWRTQQLTCPGGMSLEYKDMPGRYTDIEAAKAAIINLKRPIVEID